jgi:hypothetical protein
MFLVAGDILLITCAVPSLLLPFLGFVTATFQIRGYEEYLTCILKEDENKMVMNIIRGISMLCYCYSVSYFGLVYKPDDVRYKVWTVLLLLVHFLLIAAAGLGLVLSSLSECVSTAVNIWSILLSTICLAIVTPTLIISLMSIISFKANKELPSCIKWAMGEKKSEKSSAATN